MLHHHTFDGIPVCTGDVLCMHDGTPRGLLGHVWKAIGALVPGDIDHCAVYIGPGGRFVEADARGVSVLTMPGTHWNAQLLVHQRLFVDTFAGAAYPLHRQRFTQRESHRIRSAVAAYCLQQAARGKPFNFNLLNAMNPKRTYCSQLVAEAYRREGISLDGKKGVPHARMFRKAVFPEAIWNSSPHRRVGTRNVSG